MHTLILYIVLIACNIVCSILLFIVATEMISDPDDEMAIPGQEKRFTCTFTGNTLPTWMITSTGGSVTLTDGMMQSFFNYLDITEIVEEGTVATLKVTADLSLNGSTYMCHIPTFEPVESGSATLTVFGR